MSFLGKMVRLATVHPPFINSMSKDFRDEANAAFAAKLKRSKLYMIGLGHGQSLAMYESSTQ